MMLTGGKNNDTLPHLSTLSFNQVIQKPSYKKLFFWIKSKIAKPQLQLLIKKAEIIVFFTLEIQRSALI